MFELPKRRLRVWRVGEHTGRRQSGSYPGSSRDEPRIAWTVAGIGYSAAQNSGEQSDV